MAGAKTELICLSELKILPCQDCFKKSCWEDGGCNFDNEDDRKILQEKINSCDGLVIGAPVYFFDVNGLTKNFMDRMRGIKINGVPAIGISLAGGTGKGLILALKIIYYFFLCLGFRGILPLPVTRFNFKQGVKSARERGKKLFQEAVSPFSGLADRLNYNFTTSFMNLDVVDENLYLLKLILSNCVKNEANGELIEKSEGYQRKVEELIRKEEKVKATAYIVKGYELACQAWEMYHK